MYERRRHSKADVDTSSKPEVANAPATASKLPRPLRRKRTANGHGHGHSSNVGGSGMELGLWSSRALLFVVAGMYSTNYASIKYLETTCEHPPCNHDPAEIAFSRFLVASMVCLPILYIQRRQIPLIMAGLECGMFVSVNYICQAEALELIPAGKCCFIGTLTVATVPLMNFLFHGKPIQPISLVSAGVALVGVAILENLIPAPFGGSTAAAAAADALIEGAGDGGGTWFLGLGKGDLLAMGQPFGFGYTVLRTDHYLEKFAHIPNRVLTLTAAQCVAVCLLTCLWVLFDNGGRLPDLTYMVEPHHMVALGWTGIVTSVGAIVLQGTALQKASATDATLIFCTEPVMASLFAGWLLNETPAASTYMGGAVIVVACVIGSFSDGGHGGGGGGNSNSNGNSPSASHSRRSLKSKSSNVDSLLPTIDPSSENNSDTRVSSLTDLHHRTAAAAHGKMNALI